MNLSEKKIVCGADVAFTGAFAFNTVAEFVLSIPREYGVSEVNMLISGDGLNKVWEKKIPFYWFTFEGCKDIYKAKIDFSEIGVGLYYYKYEIVSDNKVLYFGRRDADGMLSEISNSNDGLIQLTLFEESENEPLWLYGGIMYHIFVDRFAKSGKCPKKPYAIINEDWYNGIPQYPKYPGANVDNDMFFGGDLYGVIEKLDYIKSLGVNCIYLSPIFDAHSNHKYDTGDYMRIDSMFGSEKALEELIKEASNRNIGIILDGVFNHTGADSIYFNKFNTYKSIGAYQSKESVYYDWFNFRRYPDDYECWWNVTILPRVKSDNPAYRKYILGKNGVIEKWMKKGVKGFRLDVADELSDSFLQELNSTLKGICSDGVIYGEVWEDASNKIAYDTRKKYFLGNELDSVMNYPIRDALIEYLKNGNAQLFSDTCNEIYSHYPKNSINLLMNVLGTHDTERILTVLGDEEHSNVENKELSVRRMPSENRKKGINLLKMAYTVIATLPGVPCIFYGDEAGMEGYRDPFNRLPYPWGKEDQDLLQYYKKIGSLRVNNSVYKHGQFKMISCTPENLVFARYNEEYFTVTAINKSEKSFSIDSDVKLYDAFNGKIINKIMPNSSEILVSKTPFQDVNITIQ